MGEATRPQGSNADDWALLIVEYANAPEFLAVQIAEAIEQAEAEACERAVDRMGWPEIHAFNDELRKGQSVYEDGGGYFLRAIGRLFGVKPKVAVINYQDAARAALRKAGEGE